MAPENKPMEKEMGLYSGFGFLASATKDFCDGQQVFLRLPKVFFVLRGRNRCLLRLQPAFFATARWRSAVKPRSVVEVVEVIVVEVVIIVVVVVVGVEKS